MTNAVPPSRRGFLRTSGLTAAGLAVGGGVGVLVGRESAASGSPAPDPATATAAPPIPFYGRRQAGVTTKAPAQLRFTAYDLARPSVRADLQTALQRLSAAAAELTAGRWLPDQLDAARGLTAGALTVTIAVGAHAIELAGAPVPAAMRPLPAFAGEQLDASRSGGDLAVQVCGDDPFLVTSATQALTAGLAGVASARWSQAGFLAGPAATDAAATPRNLMGQLDGTDNPTGSRLELAVWASDPATPWMVDGSYLVTRRIRMHLDTWRLLDVPAREQVIGRRLDSGAPLTGGDEHTVPDFAANSADGKPVIAVDAHLRLTHPANNGGATMLRRGYSFDDGFRVDGTADTGLFFQSFQTDPHAVFVPIQQRLSASDALTPFITHEGSGLFAVPPGAPGPGHWVGEGMFR